MRIKLGSGLLATNILAIILVLVINFVPGNVVRIVLGLPFVLFFPGYILIVALFPRKESMGGIQLLALSFGLSFAIIPLIGLLINYTLWGLQLKSILYSIFIFLIIGSVIAWLRSRSLPPASRRVYSFTLGMPNLNHNKLERGLFIVLIIVVLGVLGTIGYVIATPKAGQKFTEFYILGINRQTTDYPTDFTLGNGQVVSVKYGNQSIGVTEQWGRVTLVIVNHEGQDTIYTVTMQIAGTQVGIPFQGNTLDSVGPIALTPEAEWEQEIGIMPQHTGNNQKVKIFLYKDGGSEPYLDLSLWINVN
jgi:uncharacterized membrane protein